MEANELRIGNKVFNPYHEKVYTVEGFKYAREVGGERRAFVSTFEHSGNTVKLSVLEPIPLSESWLQKAGATSAGDEWKLGNFTVKKQDGNFLVDAGKSPVKVTYVHDLQNLYFYFHGKTELEFVSFHLHKSYFCWAK